MRSETRERIWKIIFEAETKAGKAFDVLLLWAIGLSVVAVMLESIDSVSARWGGALKIAEWSFTILFMAEYFVRIWVVRRPARSTRLPTPSTSTRDRTTSASRVPNAQSR